MGSKDEGMGEIPSLNFRIFVCGPSSRWLPPDGAQEPQAARAIDISQPVAFSPLAFPNHNVLHGGFDGLERMRGELDSVGQNILGDLFWT